MLSWITKIKLELIVYKAMFAKKYDAGVSSILTCKRKVENNQEQSKPIYHYVAKPPPPPKKKTIIKSGAL
jgi:hypothetical protein